MSLSCWVGGFAVWFALWFVVRFALRFTHPLGLTARLPFGGAGFAGRGFLDISMSKGEL